MTPLVKRAECRDLACHGRGGVVLLAEESKVGADQIRIRFADCLGERGAFDHLDRVGISACFERKFFVRLIDRLTRFVNEVFDELTEIRAITTSCVRAEMAFVSEVAREALCDGEGGHP